MVILTGGAASIIVDGPRGLSKKKTLKTDLSNGKNIGLSMEACYPLKGGLIVGNDSSPCGSNPIKLPFLACWIVEVVQDTLITETP